MSRATTFTNVDWAKLVLEDGGFKTTQNNMTFMLDWMASENAPTTWTGTAGSNNPLNNGLGSGGGDGTGSYATLTTAALYAAEGIHGGIAGTSALASALSQGATPSITENALWHSTWASGHYGYGSNWHTGAVATVTAAASAAAGATQGVVVGLESIATGKHPTGTSGGIGATPVTTPVGYTKTKLLGGGPAVTGSTLNPLNWSPVIADLVKIFTSSYWKRGLVIGIGIILVIGGAVVVLHDSNTVQSAEGTAASIASIAAVA